MEEVVTTSFLKALAYRFGRLARCYYVDLDRIGLEPFPEVEEALAAGARLPLVFIGPRLAFAGAFQPSKVLAEVEKELASRRVG